MKCPSCGYLVFGGEKTCPKCRAILPARDVNGIAADGEPDNGMTDNVPAANEAADNKEVNNVLTDIAEEIHEDALPAAPQAPSQAQAVETRHQPAERWQGDWDRIAASVVRKHGLPRRAPPGRKAIAHLIDHSVVVISTAALSFLIIALFGEDPRNVSPMSAVIPLIVFVFLIDAVYFTFFNAMASQTPGKMLLGLRLVSDDGSPCTFSCALIRWAVSFVLALPLGIGLLFGLQDKMTKSYVSEKL